MSDEVSPIIVSNKDGVINIEMSAIEFISIGNILNVRSHVVLRDGDLTVHKIEFTDGETARISYKSDGKLQQFVTTHIRTEIIDGRQIVLHMIQK